MATSAEGKPSIAPQLAGQARFVKPSDVDTSARTGRSIALSVGHGTITELVRLWDVKGTREDRNIAPVVGIESRTKLVKLLDVVRSLGERNYCGKCR